MWAWEGGSRRGQQRDKSTAEGRQRPPLVLLPWKQFDRFPSLCPASWLPGGCALATPHPTPPHPTPIPHLLPAALLLGLLLPLSRHLLLGLLHCGQNAG